MRSLLIEVDRLPTAGAGSLTLSAFPQLLEEGMQLWRRVALQRADDLYEAVGLFEPAVIVFLGRQESAEAWRRLSLEMFPQLFAMAHPLADTELVIDAINQRCRELRRSRLATRPVRQPAHQARGSVEPFAADEAMRTRAQAWITRYRLESLRQRLDPQAFERGLYCLALLEQSLAPPPKGAQLLDVGCHRWSYAPFLRAFIGRGKRAVLTGVELDPWYLQDDGLTRADWARYFATLARGGFQAGDARELELAPQDLITLLLPIVLPENALRWGIPLSHHDPAGLLAHLLSLLRPGGQLLIYNGAEPEYEATLAVLSRIGWQQWVSGPHHCPLRRGPYGYFTRLQKAGP